MGMSITKEHFTKEDYREFSDKLRDNLVALRKILSNPDFGIGPSSLGAEVEFYLVDANGAPAPCNQAILMAANNHQLAPELNQFNLEYNLKPQALQGKPFTAFENELNQALVSLHPFSQNNGAEIIPIGILPTLDPSHFGQRVMTDLLRYHAMDRALRRLRGSSFEVFIDGDPPLNLTWEDVTLEGAATSYQLHWRVNPAEFCLCFNAIQLVTPVILGLAANSPTLFGHNLWEETRIPLFKQSIDYRRSDSDKKRYPPRVHYGHDWLQNDPWELFAASVANFPPILPETSTEVPLALISAGKLPELNELNLHQGTIWPWNRAIYDHHDGGHIRIEARALPAGPSLVDMSANAAFMLGCALAVKQSMQERIELLSFKACETNFYRAAQHGLQADILWPSPGKKQIIKYNLIDLAKRLIPLAYSALVDAGMDQDESSRLMRIIQERVDKPINGAQWQRQQVKIFEQLGASRQQALSKMFQNYRDNYRSNKPISQWELQDG